MIFMTREQMREYDRIAIEEYGMPGALLMENAGRGAADIVEQYLRPSGVASIICGGGNNGGDGFVIARHLTNRGYIVKVYLLTARERVTGDAELNLNIFDKMNGEIVDCSQALSPHQEEIEASDVVVDAMLGTGLTSEVRGPILDAIALINRAPPPKVAIDIPSGISADTGQRLGAAVQATATITFGFLKRGLLLFPGAEHAGSVHVIDIGAPAQAADQAGHDGKLLKEEDVAALVTPRKADATKRTYGQALIMSGPPGKLGPALLCAEAAIRAGSGHVTVVSTLDGQQQVEAEIREIKFDHVLETAGSEPSEEAYSKLDSLIDGTSVIAVGPGCATMPPMESLVRKLFEKARQPVIVDGDALGLFAEDSGASQSFEAPLILTASALEMAGLAAKDVESVQADRTRVALDQAERCNAIVVLKGAHTIVAAPDGSLFINSTGNPGMATAGMGAVLTGLIAALLAQGHDPLEAACIGVFLHGLAGDRATLTRGERGLVSSDVIETIPKILSQWENGKLLASS